MGGTGRGTDDVFLQDVRALLIEDRRSGAEGLNDFCRLGREGQVRRDEGPGMLQFADQAGEARFVGHLGVGRADSCPAEDLVQRREVSAAVLSEVDLQHVDAEHIGHADHVLQAALYRGQGTGVTQVRGDQPQVEQQLTLAQVDAFRNRDRLAAPCGGTAADIVQCAL